ncbi:hypothetical protein PsYK624_133900 [Phanerochaete sordida]|uniref:Uncharacterized protein n=1 Tax=Phanerochaete sordida TaxID=48140 RepID=A0A9P3GKH7_9APHY|nr:hypothetical protein PsYK624_133900 [Phanerochaete sordida]
MPTTRNVHFVTDYPRNVQNGLPGMIVPQFVYEAPRPTGHARDEALPTLMFHSADGTLGVRVQDVLDGRAHIARAEDAPRLSLTGTRVSLRICWPGYEDWTFNNAINLFDSTPAKKPVKLARIVDKIALAVSAFYSEMGTVTAKDDGAWDVRRIPLESLYLVELRQVLQASWQPVICADIH